MSPRTKMAQPIAIPAITPVLTEVPPCVAAENLCCQFHTLALKLHFKGKDIIFSAEREREYRCDLNYLGKHMEMQ